MQTSVILWRHAQAETLSGEMDDLERRLTEKGERQAKAMAKWLNPRLSKKAVVLTSSALRATQTADALHRPYQIEPLLNPESPVAAVRNMLADQLAAQSLISENPQLVLVGHQPWVGQLLMQLLEVQEVYFSVQKGAVWWLHQQKQNAADNAHHYKVIAMMSPAAM